MSFAELLPALTDSEYEGLKAAIAKDGQQVPIITDEHGEIIDGYHRQRACKELGVEPRTETRAGLSEDVKHDLALALNLHRRHLSTGQRAELHARLREHGMSAREIAETTGVHHTTVLDDLAGGGNPPPDRVTGKDGKSYPATKPSPAKKPAEQNGNARKRNAAPSLDTKRGQQVAAKERKRVASGLAGIEGTCRGLRDLRLEVVLSVATEEDIGWWGEVAKDAIKTLREFEKAIRGGVNANGMGA